MSDGGASLDAAYAAAQDEARRLAAAGDHQDLTKRNGQNIFNAFADWCDGYGFVSLPAEATTVLRYLALVAHVGFAPGSVRNVESAIRDVHVRSGHPSPGLKGANHKATARLLRGITRGYTKPNRQAPPMMLEDLHLALTYEDRSSRQLAEHAILGLSRQFGVPFAQACGAVLVGAVADRLEIALPAYRGIAARVIVVAPGDGSWLDPHAQLVALAEHFGAAEMQVPIGWVSDDPNHPIKRRPSDIRDRLVRRCRANNVDPHLDHGLQPWATTASDAAAMEVLRVLHSGWLMRAQMDAFVVLAFAGALRGGEQRALRVRQWRNTVADGGVTIHVPPFKKGDEAEIEIPFELGGGIRPVDIVDRWIAVAGLGPDDVLFPSLQNVGANAARIDRAGEPISHTALLSRLAELSKDAGLAARMKGHSGRRGFATVAADAGVPLDLVADHLRHKRLATLRRYIERHAAGLYGRSVGDAMLRSLDGRAT